MRSPVGLGQQGWNGRAKNSGTIIAVNVHHNKYSILKREIKKRLNTNQKHSNIDEELILSYKATRRGLSLYKTLTFASFYIKNNHLSPP